MDLSGKILYECFNGMSNYYLVVNDTGSSVMLKEIKLEPCEPDEANDPVHRTFRLAKNEKGEYQTYGEQIIKRKMNGRIKAPNYKGCYLHIEENPEEKITMYWG